MTNSIDARDLLITIGEQTVNLRIMNELISRQQNEIASLNRELYLVKRDLAREKNEKFEEAEPAGFTEWLMEKDIKENYSDLSSTSTTGKRDDN